MPTLNMDTLICLVCSTTVATHPPFALHEGGVNDIYRGFEDVSMDQVGIDVATIQLESILLHIPLKLKLLQNLLKLKLL